MNQNPNQTDIDDEMENNQIVQLYRRALTKETTPPALDKAILESFRRELAAAQNDPVYLIKHGLAFSQRILPLAASDGTHKRVALCLNIYCFCNLTKQVML